MWPPAADVRVRLQPRWDAAVAALWREELAAASSDLAALAEEAERQGDDGSLPYTFAHLTLAECLAGRLEAAAAHAARGREIAEQVQAEGELAFLLAVEALVDAHRGRSEAAGRRGAAAAAAGRATGLHAAVVVGTGAVGLAALGEGRPTDARAAMAPVVGELLERGVRDPAAARLVPDLIEAQLAEDPGGASPLQDAWDAMAAASGRPWPLGTAARCRGLRHALAGDLPAARRELEGAVALLRLSLIHI